MKQLERDMLVFAKMRDITQPVETWADEFRAFAEARRKQRLGYGEPVPVHHPSKREDAPMKATPKSVSRVNTKLSDMIGGELQVGTWRVRRDGKLMRGLHFPTIGRATVMACEERHKRHDCEVEFRLHNTRVVMRA